eukprot:307924-Chlamydomonas_euryale.AAC.9
MQCCLNSIRQHWIVTTVAATLAHGQNLQKEYEARRWRFASWLAADTAYPHSSMPHWSTTDQGRCRQSKPFQSFQQPRPLGCHLAPHSPRQPSQPGAVWLPADFHAAATYRGGDQVAIPVTQFQQRGTSAASRRVARRAHTQTTLRRPCVPCWIGRGALLGLSLGHDDKLGRGRRQRLVLRRAVVAVRLAVLRATGQEEGRRPS